MDNEVAELQRWIDECVRFVRDREEFVIPAERQTEFLLLIGVAGRVVGYAEAYQSLVGTGFANESVPLARAAFEHAVSLEWIFLIDGGIDRFWRTVVHGATRFYGTLAEWTKAADISAELDRLPQPAPGKQLPKFIQMLQDLDYHDALKRTYDVLSQHVHVSHSAVTSALQEGPDDGISIDFTAENAFDYAVVYAVALSCMLTRWVLASLIEDADQLEHLVAMSTALSLPSSLEHQIPVEKRRPGW